MSRVRLLNLRFCWTSFMQNTPFHCPPMHPSHRALAICTRRAPGDIFVLCLTHRAPVIYTAYTSTSLPLCVFLSHSLILPHSSCSLSISFWRVAARTHTPAHTHIGIRTREHAKEVAPSHGECRRAVSNPVPGRVGLLGD